MGRPRKIPSYRLHKPTGQAVVRLDGRDHYLGKHGTEASREKYDRLIAEWLTSGRVDPGPQRGDPSPGPSPSVNEVLLAFWEHAQSYYAEHTGEADNYRLSMRPVRKLYGGTPARQFGPLALRAVREEMIHSGLARGTVNARINRVRRVFKWAAGMEMVPVTAYQALLTVPGLRKGHTEAPEAEPIKPVPVADVEATLPHLPAPVAGLVQVQLATGCRPGEAMAMRADEIDRSGAVWVCRPGKHKNQHRGLDRAIFLGPKAQEAVKPFLRVQCPLCGMEGPARHLNWQGDLCGPCADRMQELNVCGPWPSVEVPGDYYLFRPGEAREELYARRRAARKSKRQPSQVARKRKENPQGKAAERYNRHAYNHAVTRACERAGVPAWTPLQLRHTAGTVLRARYGVEAAKVVLGHPRVETSQIYAERDFDRARQIMGEVG